MDMSKCLARKLFGIARSTYWRTPIAQTPADPDADLRATLRKYAREHPLHGFRRAWAHLRHDLSLSVNKKKVHRLLKEEGLQVRIYHPRQRTGVSSTPQIEADAPKVVWAIDFQFDSTVDGKAIKFCIDDRRTHEIVGAQHRGAVDHRAAIDRGVGQAVCVVGRSATGCCEWTTYPSSFCMCCNSSPAIGSESLTFRRAHHGTTDTSSRSTIGFGRNVSTANTGPASSKQES